MVEADGVPEVTTNSVVVPVVVKSSRKSLPKTGYVKKRKKSNKK
jgi:hypothetical protein